MTPRQIVHDTLAFADPPRVPRDLWLLPWAEERYGREIGALKSRFPMDMGKPPDCLREPPRTQGDRYGAGTYVDPWGCRFVNIQDGVVGEVKEPQVLAEDWSDAAKVRFPRELLSLDVERVNAFCGGTDLFVTTTFNPQPFQLLQFLRGTENLLVDLVSGPPPRMLAFLDSVHGFYCDVLRLWARTDVDALNLVDDWGAQNSLLIPPPLWRRLFRPLYRDYIAIAHGAGKKAFLHSDGYILPILDDLIEIGLDALNSQIFCMGPERLRPYAGRITFWGEMDRQRLLCSGSGEEIAAAVREVRDNLWRRGGCIAQLEFGAGAKPQNVLRTYEEWDRRPGKENG